MQKQIINNWQTFIFLRNGIGSKLVFAICAVLCLTPWVSPPVALLLGLTVAQLSGHPYLHLNHKATHWLLQLSVVGLGFGMNLHSAVKAGSQGLGFTVISISMTLLFGLILGKWMGIDRRTSFLISSGTAICGGSAIAAISPVIRPEQKQISAALGCIFILNSAALFIFPWIGAELNLTQSQFGLWCALAIHDTSSVVGAASKYGPQALEIATTVKLARALWILPVAFVASLLFKNKSGKVSIPYFIGFFILAMVLNTYVPQIALISQFFIRIAHMGLSLTLFLIGAGLSRQVLRSIGVKPMLQGILLWTGISLAALYAVMHFAGD
ncbi:YeiH family protein [Dyadobacter luticola]|uniref:Putative sulfate exporter family transporter n=1 Tax=Dyadobacter luticola TaxID=1979387 RepID=A0A5R9KZ40_9BACT|nr:putative sulfate exporter family transporter [Dyadobacter luticola]TLV01360.1 putative sulfate exporter family transporter [Dyadobacter luticola]